MATSPIFRPLQKHELTVLLSWAAAEGWNPGHTDAAAFWAADPNGFWGMEWEGKLIGGASTVVNEGFLGFVGLFIVLPEYRHRGWGLAFWHYFMERLRERIGPNGGAALDGVFHMQEKYALSGFRFSHRNLRMEGEGQAAPLDPALRPLAECDFAEIVAFDREHFGAARPEFLQHWIAPAGGAALAWQTASGGLAGYGVIRPCQEGFKIGPLFARTPDIAQALFSGLSQHAKGQRLYLDVPENHPEAIALAARHGMREVFGCARMTLGRFPELPWTHIYGVTTFELG